MVQRLGWIRLEMEYSSYSYGEMTEEFSECLVTSSSRCIFAAISTEISIVLMMQHWCVEF